MNCIIFILAPKIKIKIWKINGKKKRKKWLEHEIDKRSKYFTLKMWIECVFLCCGWETGK
jgi:hypothetical protein